MDKQHNLLTQKSGKFTELITNENPVANYLSGTLSEEHLINIIPSVENLEDIKYAIIALNWHFNHKSIAYEMAYVKLRENKPNTQEDYDTILKGLQDLFPVPTSN